MMYLPPVLKYVMIFAFLILALFIGYKVIKKFFSGVINEPSVTGGSGFTD